MEARTREQIRAITSAIDRHIGILRGHGLDQAALMLDMVRIDLQSQVNSITHEEFVEFCRALEKRQTAAAPAPRRRKACAPRSASDGLFDRRHQLLERKRLG
jgi:hypothetical protein